MKLTTLAGTIERCLLINYRVDPEVIARVLPQPFEPVLVEGYAIAGICLIELRVRPAWLPRQIGLRSMNGAHRIAVTLPDGTNAVYVPRRDTSSRLNTLVGGRLFPGSQHLADTYIEEFDNEIYTKLTSRDEQTHVDVTARPSNRLQPGSVFESVRQVSDFFESGSIGYSDTSREGRYDGIELRTTNWTVAPLEVGHVESSFFDNQDLFPSGSIELDNALLMRNIDHTWHRRSPIRQDSFVADVSARR